MDLTRLIQHPETMDKETLYDLRSLLALHPYYQTARLLMLQNLYLLHDSSFDEELRRAAIYLTDRKVLFNLIEAAHYQLKRADKDKQNPQSQPVDDDRTISLIDNFLETIPADEGETNKKRKPTPADAAVDYVAYLMEVENSEEQKDASPSLHLKGQELIDSFIEKSGDGRIQLSDTPEYLPELQEENENSEPDEGYFTETLAKIYIKQGRYEQALEIIQRLNLNYPKKNSYFADQLRFLEKLILNNKINR
ncbi:tetratricopeptide repeat protein [Prevotella sp. SGI.027]|nr:tetratricopeptide repeat protein [Prevotella sp.]